MSERRILSGALTPGHDFRPLPYVENLAARALETIDTLIIHCTELPDLAMARDYGEQIHYPESGTGNSGHFYIDRDGRIEQWVPLHRIAHHVRDHNATSVGIELVNLGRYPEWFHSQHQAMQEGYATIQVAALGALITRLEGSLPGLKHIAGHEDLDTGRVTASDDKTRQVRRKQDPGPQFPWPQILADTALERLQQ